MPMVKITLACGCVAVAHYRQKEPWTLIPKKAKEAIIEGAKAAHQCAKKAPVVNPATGPN